MLHWEQQATCGAARRGTLHTDHGTVETPIFMPVGTCGSVKGLTAAQLAETGSTMILANTYHMLLRPGPETVRELGGLHTMMAWDGPILTDSGGYQVFSLAHMRKIAENGVTFQSHINGATVEMTPENVVDTQHILGPDVMMQLDICAASDATREEFADAMETSVRWARQSREAWDERGRVSVQGHSQALFAIQQGGIHADLRRESAERLVELDLPGYAVGGLAIGEGHEVMCNVLDDIDELLPQTKPRYLMGVGEPRDILAAVARGIDMFDCVMPTRNARNTQAFTWDGRVKMKNAIHTRDAEPIDSNCGCYACRHYSRGTIRHLFTANEMLAPTLMTIHNLHFFAEFLAAIRESISAGTFAEDSVRWLEKMYHKA